MIRTSLTLAPASFLASVRRSGGVLAHDFLQDLAEVGGGTGLSGEAGESGELLHVGLVLLILVSDNCEVMVEGTG